jgi:UDP-glucose 4-epimerase
VMGTYQVVEACVRAAVRRLVFASSTAVLGTDWGRRDRVPRYLPFDEDHPLEPEDVYGLSKVVGEAVARAAHLRTGIEVAVLRPAWIVTDDELEELRRSEGAAPRGIHHHAYVHVRDAADAFVRAAEAELRYEAMYLAADDSTLQEPLSTVLPREFPAIGDMATSLSGTRPGLSNARAKAVLGWRPGRSWRGRT